MTKQELIKVYGIIDYLEGLGVSERVVIELRDWAMKKALEEK